MRIILVADHASLRMGGEAALPVHYFRHLTDRGLDTHLIVHERTRAELTGLFADRIARIHFLPDTALNRFCWTIERSLPDRIGYFTAGYISRHLTQRTARKTARQLVSSAKGAALIHQPIPVSPHEPSLLYDMGAPVVIGPMNGNITWARGFRSRAGEMADRLLSVVSRPIRRLPHLLSPGKRQARLLLSSNPRTTRAIRETGTAAPVTELVENGIDAALWQPAPLPEGPAEFLFIGRLVAFKGAQYLPDILARMTDRTARISLIGEGPMAGIIRKRAEELGLADRITLHGFLPQSACVAHLARARALVLPSLAEAGGAVVLEAMTCARPVVAADHGGPADYIRPGTGWLIPPVSPGALIRGFAERMDKLAADPALVREAGQRARAHVLQHYDWNSKIDTVLGLYQSCLLAKK